MESRLPIRLRKSGASGMIDKMKTRIRAACYAAALMTVVLSAGGAFAHHSTLGVYDVDNVVEIEGTVTAVRWQNPHPTYSVAVADNGGTVEWRVETGAISTLRLRGLERDFIQVGDWVRMAGEASNRGRPELFARNLLLPDGREVLISASSRPRWSRGDPSRLFEPEFDQRLAEQARREADGIFRVWTSVFGDTDSFPLYGAADYPMTERGAELKSAWDPRTSPYLTCGTKGMPYVMVTPYPIKLERRGEDIAIRFEEFNATRIIHMDGARTPDDEPFSPLGYSAGRWDGDVLVVETDRIDSPHFYGDGTPQSRAMRTVERFETSSDGSRLDYALHVEDPEIFSRPMDFDRYWAWKPEIGLEPFECEL
jgi:hypothetical protein